MYNLKTLDWTENAINDFLVFDTKEVKQLSL